MSETLTRRLQFQKWVLALVRVVAEVWRRAMCATISDIAGQALRDDKPFIGMCLDCVLIRYSAGQSRPPCGRMWTEKYFFVGPFRKMFSQMLSVEPHRCSRIAYAQNKMPVHHSNALKLSDFHILRQVAMYWYCGPLSILPAIGQGREIH